MSEAAPQMSQLSCSVAPLAEMAAEMTSEPKTVGTPFLLSCQGEFEGKITELPSFQFGEEQNPFLIHPLKVRASSEEHLDLVVTSYVVGDHQGITPFVMVSGANVYQAEGVSFTVASVLTEESPPEGYPPYGPFSVSYPLWLWLSIALVILSIIFVLSRSFRLRRQKRELIEKVLGQNYDTSNLNEVIRTGARHAYQDFNKEMRVLQKRIEAGRESDPNLLFRDIQNTFDLYLVKRFLVPVRDWSVKAILKDIKKNHKKIHQTHARPMAFLLREIKKARGRRVDSSDCEQMFKKIRKLVDGIETQKKEGPK